MFELFSAQW
jgi:hypothetical protein